ncbi:hypothetical protein FEM48_Zijuj02G0026300 [Ziziphus jujuba var. spinosa]|uniref:Phytocyanin domain-containing protein n=1 Tax=Ziziphus jujuba var. spinosa TaxID=714518 RepID=A0A978VT48_ZIZJJ|nr:hypothetical protein FEM48_Zijuj02G0026300 [Ziziphus jujuba var. spinosa]
MEQRRNSLGLPTFFIILNCFVLLLCFSRSVQAYKNYTVGDSLGWYDNQEKPNINYQKWASGKSFSLGDFLIFNTNNNHSVIQTYNFTTYKLCDYDNALDNDTTQWSQDKPSNTATHGVSVAVPLLKEGPTYFFSGDYDGEQCENGQHFMINVTHGQGLPKSLQDPSNESPGPTSPQSGDDDESAPDTIVPSNFNHPQEEEADDDKKDASGASLPMLSMELKMWSAIFSILGLAYIF